jgi:hypothetical protein
VSSDNDATSNPVDHETCQATFACETGVRESTQDGRTGILCRPRKSEDRIGIVASSPEPEPGLVGVEKDIEWAG